MERTYKRKNGTIIVTLPESCDREKLRKATEEFMKKAISGGKKNVNSNTSNYIRKEQILH